MTQRTHPNWWTWSSFPMKNGKESHWLDVPKSLRHTHRNLHLRLLQKRWLYKVLTWGGVNSNPPKIKSPQNPLTLQVVLPKSWKNAKRGVCLKSWSTAQEHHRGLYSQRFSSLCTASESCHLQKHWWLSSCWVYQWWTLWHGVGTTTSS